jgi:hypothetical protein
MERRRNHHVVVLEGAAALVEGEVLDGAVGDGAAEGEEPTSPVLGPQLGLARRVGRELVAVEAVAGVDLHARSSSVHLIHFVIRAREEMVGGGIEHRVIDGSAGT